MGSGSGKIEDREEVAPRPPCFFPQIKMEREETHTSKDGADKAGRQEKGAAYCGKQRAREFAKGRRRQKGRKEARLGRERDRKRSEGYACA
jgi:hypothetical protein